MEPEYRYLEPDENDQLNHGIAWGLPLGLALWFLIFLGALFLIPYLLPGSSP